MSNNCHESPRCEHLNLLNTPTQTESLLPSLKQATRNIGLFVNSDKTVFTCFNQDSTIPSLNGKPLKLVDEFMYLGRKISSTESYVNICINNSWTAIER